MNGKSDNRYVDPEIDRWAKVAELVRSCFPIVEQASEAFRRVELPTGSLGIVEKVDHEKREVTLTMHWEKD